MYHLSRVVRKPAFCICENKDTDYIASRGNREVTGKLISAFVFTTQIVQSLYFLNPKFQASSHLLCLYSLVFVGPGRKPRRPVFSQRGSLCTGMHFSQRGSLCTGMLLLKSCFNHLAYLLLLCANLRLCTLIRFSTVILAIL